MKTFGSLKVTKTRVPAEGPHRPLREPEKLSHRGRILPGGSLRKPRGVREMVQGDHRFDPGLPERGRDPDVPVHRLPVPLPAAGRHPAPLHRKPVGVDAERRQEGQVLVRAREVSHAVQPRPPVVLVPHLPMGPVAPRRALHLERGGRSPKATLPPVIVGKPVPAPGERAGTPPCIKPIRTDRGPEAPLRGLRLGRSCAALEYRDGRVISLLFRGYLRLGAKVCGPPAYDRPFGTTDFFVLAKTRDIVGRYSRRFPW